MPPAHSLESRPALESREIRAGGIVCDVVSVRSVKISARGPLQAVDRFGFTVDTAHAGVRRELVLASLEAEHRVAVHAEGVCSQSFGKRIFSSQTAVHSGEHEARGRGVLPEFLFQA